MATIKVPKIGIVGAEAAKFTDKGRITAQTLIYEILREAGPSAVVVSGACHLGGIDIWAEALADKLGLAKEIYPPAVLEWERGYKPRNLNIAYSSDIVHNIVVDRYPPGYVGMRFGSCYHCDSRDHVKSGGCWTMKKARYGKLHIISNL